jgi:hypothetical protein
MTDMICCPLESGDGESAAVYTHTYPVARKPHRCSECDDGIPRGARHELYKLLFDGSWSTDRTCMSCVEIRDHFRCSGGAIIGQLWSDLADNFFPDMRAGGPCMEGLSPEAKARLFERRLQWMEDSR